MGIYHKQKEPQSQPLACPGAWEFQVAPGGDGKPDYHQEAFLGKHFWVIV